MLRWNGWPNAGWTRAGTPALQTIERKLADSVACRFAGDDVRAAIIKPDWKPVERQGGGSAIAQFVIVDVHDSRTRPCRSFHPNCIAGCDDNVEPNRQMLRPEWVKVLPGSTDNRRSGEPVLKLPDHTPSLGPVDPNVRDGQLDCRVQFKIVGIKEADTSRLRRKRCQQCWAGVPQPPGPAVVRRTRRERRVRAVREPVAHKGNRLQRETVWTCVGHAKRLSTSLVRRIELTDATRDRRDRPPIADPGQVSDRERTLDFGARTDAVHKFAIGGKQVQRPQIVHQHISIVQRGHLIVLSTTSSMVATLSLEFARSLTDPAIGSQHVSKRIVDNHAVRTIQYMEGVGIWCPCHAQDATQGVGQLIAEQRTGL